jgi:hypothetical protein
MKRYFPKDFRALANWFAPQTSYHIAVRGGTLTPGQADARRRILKTPPFARGRLGKSSKPAVEVESGDVVTIEALTLHANDDAARMATGSGTDRVAGHILDGS